MGDILLRGYSPGGDFVLEEILSEGILSWNHYRDQWLNWGNFEIFVFLAEFQCAHFTQKFYLFEEYLVSQKVQTFEHRTLNLLFDLNVIFHFDREHFNLSFETEFA